MGDATWIDRVTDSVSALYKKFLDKTLENFSSMKLYAIVIASFLLWKGKLSEDYWFYSIALCIATRNVTEVMSVIKEIKGFKHGIGTDVPPKDGA